MCRGTTLLHIHRGPPYTFAQITPLNPIFMGHRFNLDNGTTNIVAAAVFVGSEFQSRIVRGKKEYFL
jgi:hypothetical protein